MIKLTVQELIDSVESIKYLMQSSLSAPIAYQVMLLGENIEKESQAYNSLRNTLIEKYGERNENNELFKNADGTVNIVKESIENFNKEIKQILQTEITLDIEPIEIKDLGDINISPAQLFKLKKYIKK